MKIAILGGGITALTASYYLSKDNHEIVVFEKESYLGGLACGFREDHWEWPLERAYHHLFAGDKDILSFAEEIGYKGIFFTSPSTDSLYYRKNKYRIIPVDSPKDFLFFPYLSLFSKIRAGIYLFILKYLPFMRAYEKITAKNFVIRYMGEEMWNIFLKDLFEKKFGKYSEKILASFLWARFKRSKKLGYMHKGFQSFIDFLEKKNRENGVDFRKDNEIKEIKKTTKGFIINSEKFDLIISTLPTPVLLKVGDGILPKSYKGSLSRLKYLHALVLILETDKPIFKKTYWLNICTNKIPLMFVGQHTNFIDKKYYGDNHISYVGYYLEKDDPLFKKSKEELQKHIETSLRKLDNNFSILKSYRFVGPFSQPIFDKEFLKNMPQFETPLKNFYVANLDMTYPYDRGTNHAVKLGREVARRVQLIQ